MRKLKVFGASLIFLINLACFVSSQSIDFNYPSEVNLGEEFEVSLKLIDFPSEIYDVKIDITGTDGSRLGKILDGEAWHSTYSYLSKAIDSSEEDKSYFKLNITTKYLGNAKIEVKIRSPSKKIETFSDYSLKIKEGAEVESNPIISEKKVESNPIISEEKEINETPEKSIIKLGNPISSKETSKNQNLLYESKNEKIKKYAIYVFNIILVIIIIILLKKR